MTQRIQLLARWTQEDLNTFIVGKYTRIGSIKAQGNLL